MYKSDSQVRFSPTDLTNHVACRHLTSLTLGVATGRLDRPPRYADPRRDALKEMGEEHERQVLAGSMDGRTVETISRDGDPTGATRDAMARGVEVIHQGRLQSTDGRFGGYPDFLIRSDRRNGDGDWLYEAMDAKLARSAKASALLQLLMYSELLHETQGAAPERMHLALGGEGNRIESFRVTEYAAYYRLVRSRFEKHVETAPETYPEPVAHCDDCDWRKSCEARWREDDHLTLVAGIRTSQRHRLVSAEIPTMTALGGLSSQRKVEGINKTSLDTIREQARVQVIGRERAKPHYELIKRDEPDIGLGALPEPDAGDLFFDIEGDAFAAEGGLEYLFGLVNRDGGYQSIWALTKNDERSAFEELIDLFMKRLEQYPDFHIYHFHHYETTAMKRLMGQYATREVEVDNLLRGKVFVDLHRVVRQGVVASVESYSIKNLEEVFGYRRALPLPGATAALVRFDAWLESGERGDVPEDVRESVRIYNEDDCQATLCLARWLEARRPELEDKIGRKVPRPTPPDPRKEEPEIVTEIHRLRQALAKDFPEDETELTPEQRARQILGHLLEFHRREDKSFWWDYFEKCGYSAEDHVGSDQTLGGLTWERELAPVKQSFVHRHRFPDQPHQIEVWSTPHDPDTKDTAGTVVALDERNRTVDLKFGRRKPRPHPRALVPVETIDAGVLKGSIRRLAEAAVADDFGMHCAAFDLLRRRSPRLVGGPAKAAEAVVALESGASQEHPPERVRRTTPALDHSVLPVQGPPGSGKTRNGAETILDLLAQGRKVGVTANSHKVISNLLGDVCEAADRRMDEGGAPPIDIRGIQKGQDDPCPDERIEKTNDNGAVASGLESGEKNLAAGTAWLWAREEMQSSVDVLVVDEAGQMSLANTVAVAQAADSLLLLGDPRQLDQPMQGVHPPGVAVSALGHVLGDARTLKPEQGAFLDRTWRLHPSICAFTSEMFYEGRLESRGGLERQRVVSRGPLSGSGLRFIPVEHEGNTKSSEQEADRIGELIDELLGNHSAWVDRCGRRKKLALDDILIVAPYNAHVATLVGTLPEGARVGTVDKFQGQEAPVVIYSMATSTPEEAPRGMGFLYSLHRLNVATSRARCVAAIVASPKILEPDCRTPEQMRLANAFCRFRELAEERAGAP